MVNLQGEYIAKSTVKLNKTNDCQYSALQAFVANVCFKNYEVKGGSQQPYHSSLQADEVWLGPQKICMTPKFVRAVIVSPRFCSTGVSLYKLTYKHCSHR